MLHITSNPLFYEASFIENICTNICMFFNNLWLYPLWTRHPDWQYFLNETIAWPGIVNRRVVTSYKGQLLYKIIGTIDFWWYITS